MASPCQGQGGSGTKYSYAELEGLWIKAGGPKAVAPIAAAIALAESGGCSAALNPTDNGGTQTSWGLWQISNGTHSQPAPNILSAGVNAQQAVAKYNGAGGFSPWGTFNSGAYRGFLSGSTTPDMNVPGSSGSSSPVQTTASVKSFDPQSCIWSFPGVPVPFLGDIGQFCILPKTAARAVLGAGLVVMGAITMIGPGLGLVALSGVMRAAPAVVGGVSRIPIAGAYTRGVTSAASAAASKAGRETVGRGERQRTAQRQAAAKQERENTRAEREAARNAPARGRHASERERRRGTGGRHARPEPAN